MEGIVIRSYPSGEADSVFRIVTQKHGKLSVYARGARRSKRRFGILDLLDWGTFEIGPSRGGLHTAHSFKPISSFKRIRTDLDRVTTATVICEAFDLLLPDGNSEPVEIFDTLKLSLQAIDEAADLKELLRICYLALAGLLELQGFSSNAERKPPSAKNLEFILTRVEHAAERELVSKQALLGMVQSLRCENSQ